MTQQQNCPVCNSVLLHESSYRNVSEHVLFDNRKIVVCDNCGFSHVAPVIEQDELNYYYEHIYRSKNSEMYIDFDSSSLDMSVVDYRSISQLLLGRQYVANKARYRLLDIGSGPGVSFISSKKIFRDVDLYAVETNRSAKRYYKQHIKGISVFDDIQEIEDKMDVV